MFPFRDGIMEGPEVCPLILVRSDPHRNQGVRGQWWPRPDLRAVLVALKFLPALMRLNPTLGGLSSQHSPQESHRLCPGLLLSPSDRPMDLEFSARPPCVSLGAGCPG